MPAAQRKETVCLVRPVVRILSQNHDPHIRQLRITECVENIFLWWVNGLTNFSFMSDNTECFNEIGLGFLMADDIMPVSDADIVSLSFIYYKSCIQLT